MSLPLRREVQALVRIRPIFDWFAHSFVPGPGCGLCSVLSSRARACRRNHQVPRVPLPDVGVTFIRESCTASCEGITPRSSLIQTHSPIPLGSPLLRLFTSFEESSQVATSPCCPWDLPSRGDPVSCRLSLAVSAVSSFGRGRDADRSAPPAQTRAGAFNAHGSYLGYLAAKRSVGYGCRMQTSGSRPPSRARKRSQVQQLR
jgi:hypothetical protein